MGAGSIPGAARAERGVCSEQLSQLRFTKAQQTVPKGQFLCSLIESPPSSCLSFSEASWTRSVSWGVWLTDQGQSQYDMRDSEELDQELGQTF